MNRPFFRGWQWLVSIFVIAVLFHGCEPLVTTFPPETSANLYEAADKTTPPSEAPVLKVMTWNIRFGAARIPWFGDTCGDRVLLTQAEIEHNLQGLADEINKIQPDILMMQEVDVQSKRSAYIDELQWLLDHTDLNYGAYASMWEAQFVPSDGLGRVNTGNAVLSRWKITNTERIKLPLRGDQDALTRYFYLRRNILKVEVAVPNTEAFYVLDIHATAFATDNTKQKHLERFKEEIDKVAETGALFVAGGDLNSLPPGSDSTNYCDEERCPGAPPGSCPDGSDYTGQAPWIEPLYNAYDFAVPLDVYQMENRLYFSQGFPKPNKKIDYLLTREGGWVPGSEQTHQDAYLLSDHVPVSARLVAAP